METEIAHLLGVPEQIVTGQSSHPVIKLIQDAVVVAFWLTHVQTDTHCPPVLPRHIIHQLAADMEHFPTFGDLLQRQDQIRTEWDAFQRRQPDHPTVRAMAAAGIDYMDTGYAVFSLCLPATCCYRSPGGNPIQSNELLALWHRRRALPRSIAEVVVERGLFLQGWLGSSTLTGRGGLLHHVYLQHGPSAGLSFLDALQRLTTCASLYAYCNSVGLDDCVLRPQACDTARRIIERRVDEMQEHTLQEKQHPRPKLPYRVEEREQIISKLIGVRSESERFVVGEALRPRVRRRRPDHHTIMTETNQIAILSMLGTKGSVSNLVSTVSLPPAP